MQTEGICQLVSSVSHIGETIGIDAEFHRIKIMQSSGEPELIPVITGNSIRGQLRDHAAQHLYETLALEPLSLSAFYLLFSGGSLTKTGANSIDVEQIRALRAILPPLSLFGAAVGNVILAGRLKVGHLIPVTQETRQLVPERWWLDTDPSIYDIMQNESYTRTDDAKNVLYDQHWVHDDDPLANSAAPQQMRYRVETMSAGTRLYWHLYVDSHATEMDTYALIAALAHWGVCPVLGGKSAVGHGQVRVDLDNGWRIAPDELTLPDITPYVEYLAQHRGTLVELLSHV